MKRLVLIVSLIFLMMTTFFAFELGVSCKAVNLDNEVFPIGVFISSTKSGSLASRFLKSGDVIIAASKLVTYESSENSNLISFPLRNTSSWHNKEISQMSVISNDLMAYQTKAITSFSAFKNVVDMMENQPVIFLVLRNDEFFEVTIK